MSSDRLASARSSSSCSLPSPEAATGRARGPVSYDLIVPSDNFVVRFARLELIGEMDHDQIDGFDNLRPDMREAGSDPGNKYSVPWATGTTGIGYDTTVFPEPLLPSTQGVGAGCGGHPGRHGQRRGSGSGVRIVALESGDLSDASTQQRLVFTEDLGEDVEDIYADAWERVQDA